jgi:hypothetical protein
MPGFIFSWKKLLIAIALLATVLLIKGAYDYVESLQNKVISLAAEVKIRTGELNMARFERNLSEARAHALLRDQEELSRRLERFNQEQAQSQAETQRQRMELESLNLDKEMNNDSHAARDRLNARTRDINRLLERRSQL